MSYYAHNVIPFVAIFEEQLYFLGEFDFLIVWKFNK